MLFWEQNKSQNDVFNESFFKKFVFGHMGFDLLCWSNNGFLMMFTKILKLLSVLFHDAFVDYVLIFWSKNFNCYTGDRRLIPTQLTAIHLASEWRDIDLHSVYNCKNRFLSLLQFIQLEIEKCSRIRQLVSVQWLTTTPSYPRSL